MASLISHPAIAVAGYFAGSLPKKLFWLCVVLTILPDADVIAFRFGIPYQSQWGHRGFTHSIAFALALSLLFSFFHQSWQASRFKVWAWTFVSTLSHAVLDAFTNGGLGVALFWPFSHQRHFAPVRPIAVSPIGILAFLGEWGIRVLSSELVYIWLPCLILSALVRLQKRTKFPS